MATPTSPLDPPKADLNHDRDNSQKQTANQADMPGKPMKLPESGKQASRGAGDNDKKPGQHKGDSQQKAGQSERDSGKAKAGGRDNGKGQGPNGPNVVSSHAEKPNHSGKEGKSRT